MMFELILATIQLTIARGNPSTNPIIQYISDPLTILHNLAIKM
jgi:hypothetical protein